MIKLATIVGSSSSKFVLADELEAITEPEAASAILAGLLDVAAKDAVNSILMVTHIGSSICGKMDSDARVDGIEAKGLDEELELVVDRVPRIGIPARSTPELILKRLKPDQTDPDQTFSSPYFKKYENIYLQNHYSLNSLFINS